VIYFYSIAFQGYHPHIGLGLFYIPLVLLLLAGIGFGGGIIVSSITTKYRDLTQLLGFAMQLVMYATPVIYAFSTLSPSMKSYLAWNPLVAPVECFKYALFGVGEFSGASLAYSGVWMVILLFIGLVIFSKAEKNFMDNV
jgi:lipopolysaccharide transport system permease protein